MNIYVVWGWAYEEGNIDKAYKRKDVAQMRADLLNAEQGENPYYWYSVEIVELIE